MLRMVSDAVVNRGGHLLLVAETAGTEVKQADNASGTSAVENGKHPAQEADQQDVEDELSSPDAGADSAAGDDTQAVAEAHAPDG